MHTRLAPLALLFALLPALLLAACASSPSGGGGSDQLLRYVRVTSDVTEETVVFADGRVQMKHGEFLERFTLPTDDLALLTAALAAPIPTGAPDDSASRTLTLADGKVVDSPRPDPGTIVALLDELTDTHGLGGGPHAPDPHASPSSPPADESHQPDASHEPGASPEPEASPEVDASLGASATAAVESPQDAAESHGG